MKTLMTKFLLLGLGYLLLSGCQTIDIRGGYVDEAAIGQLQNNNLTKVEVTKLLGTPTLVPDYSPNTWYYVQRTLSTRPWLAPRVITERVVRVEFNHDKVTLVTVLNDQHHKEIHQVSEYTKTHGTEASGIQKFVKNLGRFNQTTGGKKRAKKSR